MIGRLRPGGTVVEYTAGVSTGANVTDAIRVAERLGPKAAVMTIVIDSGRRYLSTGVYRERQHDA